MSSSVYIFENQSNKGTILLRKILQNSGLEVSTHNSLSIPTTFENIDNTLFIDANWLAALPNTKPFFNILKKRSRHLFIYNWNDSKLHNSIIKNFISSATVKKTTTASMHWRENLFCKSLAGQSSEFVSESFTFDTSTEHDDVYVMLDDYPILLSAQMGLSSIYFMPEINSNAIDTFSHSDEQEKFFLMSISPIILFLRNFLLDKIWHAKEKMRCFILDDPPLRTSYGFVNYSEMLKAVNSIGAVSIAFIPWYYMKSKAKIAKMISESNGSLSLCIHGCDHTWNEFCCTTSRVTILLSEALRRMKYHSKYYDIRYDKIFVFPQGRFSLNSLKALSNSEITAAVNTTFFSHGDEVKITSTDLISPVIVRFGFPLFRRRYPSDNIGQALDRLLDRPVFFAEHHTFFRNGYAKLRELFQSNTNVVWSNPENIVNRFYQTRTDNNGEMFIRFFSSNFTYNHKKQSGTVFFETKAVGTFPKSVLLNGKEIVFKYSDKTVSFSSFVMQDCEILISITKQTNLIAGKYSKNFKQRLYIRQRRYFSEFRDNYISKYKPISNLYEFIRNLARH